MYMTHLIALLTLVLCTGDPATQPDVSPADQKKANELMVDGWKHWQKQEFSDAANLFQQAVDLDPNNANAWNGLGWAKFNSGEPDEAVPAFKKCVEIEPQHPAGLNGLGQIALYQGKLDEAEQ